MTNDATRAKGEALPAMTRRTALATTGAALAAALSGVAASAAAPAASSLAGKIAAHRAAYAAFSASLDRIEEFEGTGDYRRELFVPLRIGGGISHITDDELIGAASRLRDGIADAYARAYRPGALERLAPAAMAQANAAFRSAHAEDIRTMRDILRRERERREASGYSDAIRRRDAARDAEAETLIAVASHRCSALAEVAMLGAYLREVAEFTGCCLPTEVQDALLTSLGVVAEG